MQALAPLLLLPVMYVLLVLPQRRRARAQQALIAEIGPGSSVMTTSGVYGTVESIEGDVAQLEIASGVVIRIARQAIARRVDAGSGAAPAVGGGA